MPVCAVITCNTSQDSNPKGLPKSLEFHRFPKNEEVKRKWIDMTGRENWTPNDTSYICSRHFRENDYIVKRSGNRHLKVSAIPCEYVVYRHLFPDEEPTPAPEVSEDREATPATSPAPAMSTSTPVLEADTTSNYDDYGNDLNDNTFGWDFQSAGDFGGLEPGPVAHKRHASGEHSSKHKRSKKSKAKKRRHRQTRGQSSEYFEPPMEEPPQAEQPQMEHFEIPEPLFEEAEPHFPLPEIGFPLDIEDPMEEVRPPTPDLRPPSAQNEALNEIKMLIASSKLFRQGASSPMYEINRANEILKNGQDDLSDMERQKAINELQNIQITMFKAKDRRMNKLVKNIIAVLKKVE